MSRQKRGYARTRLQRELQYLNAARTNKANLMLVPSNDPHDQVQLAVSLDLAARAIDVGWQTTKAIQAALDRIDTDEYGICEACGGPIVPKRLHAIPWATLCTPCQSSREAAEESTRILQNVA